MDVVKKAARAQQQKVGKTIPEQAGRRSMTRDAGRPAAAQAAWVHLRGAMDTGEPSPVDQHWHRPLVQSDLQAALHRLLRCRLDNSTHSGSP